MFIRIHVCIPIYTSRDMIIGDQILVACQEDTHHYLDIISCVAHNGTHNQCVAQLPDPNYACL
jgi:hypothetical protein